MATSMFVKQVGENNLFKIHKFDNTYIRDPQEIWIMESWRDIIGAFQSISTNWLVNQLSHPKSKIGAPVEMYRFWIGVATAQICLSSGIAMHLFLGQGKRHNPELRDIDDEYKFD